MPLDESVKKELTDAVQDAQKSGIVQGMQKVLALLSKHGLLQSQVIEPSLVGVHPSNRDGLGIVPHSVHQLLEDIASVGFDSRQCDPMCTDVAPGDREIERFNLQLAESSQGTIPVIEANKLKYVSLSCSHTNTALRCIIMGAPHQYEGSQLTINGKLQLEQVRLKDPAMAQSAETGLTWRVINHEAMSVEGLADLLQAAANTSAQLSRGESEFQILRRVINMINVKGSAGQVQFAAVKSTIMRTKPQCADAIPDMFTFLVRHGAAKHLQEKLLMTEQRMKACKLECRSLGKDFFHALGMDPKDTRQDPLVILRHAVLAFGYCNPNPKQISVQDVRKLAIKDPAIHEKLKKGQEFLKKMRAMYGSNPEIKDLQKEHADAVLEALHCFEDNVVLFVMDKKIAFPSLQHIGWSFVNAVEKITGFKITNEFDGYLMKETASSSNSKPTEKSSTIRKLNEDGLLEDEAAILEELGFQVGSVVMRKADKVRGVIQSMHESTVVIEVHDGPITGTAQVSADGFRRGQWKISKEKVAPLDVAGDKHSAFAKSRELKLRVVQGKVAAALLAAEEKSKSCLQGLKITLKPSRDVMTVKEFAKGDLILNPATPKIVTTDNPTGGMISLGKIDGFPIHLVPHFQGPDKDGCYDDAFLPPFWAVRTTHDESKSNMEMHLVYDPTKTNNAAKVTVMRNTKDIGENEVLLRWVPKKENVEVLEELVPCPPAAKRRMTTKGNGQ